MSDASELSTHIKPILTSRGVALWIEGRRYASSHSEVASQDSLPKRIESARSTTALFVFRTGQPSSCSTGIDLTTD